jgi:hypothetical protein
MAGRKRTTTSNFGVGARENHDASGFYGRFRPPVLSSDDTVLQPVPVAEPFQCGDARDEANTRAPVLTVVARGRGRRPPRRPAAPTSRSGAAGGPARRAGTRAAGPAPGSRA